MKIEKTKHTPSVQVIIAALNEEEGIAPTIAELRGILDNIEVKFLVVDGNSVDATVEKAKCLGAEIIFQEGSGKGHAVAKAIEHIADTTDYVVFTDADFTYPAKYVPEMIQTLEKNPDIGMVCGNRFSGYSTLKGVHSIFYLGNRLLAFAHYLLNGIQLVDPLTGLRVLRASILRKWKVKSLGFDLEVEFNNYVERSGFRIAEIPIEYRERLGQKKLGAIHGAEILKRMILETTY